jgi:hypothetical protein
MSELQLEAFVDEGLNLTPAYDGSEVTLTLTGSATVYHPESLRSYLQTLHAENKRLGVKRVVVDLRELEFMNSAGFSTFIDWLVTLQEEPETSQYMVCYRSNAEYPWQRRSLHALQCLAVDLVTIES